jgi:hypothetical protein
MDLLENFSFTPSVPLAEAIFRHNDRLALVDSDTRRSDRGAEDDEDDDQEDALADDLSASGTGAMESTFPPPDQEQRVIAERMYHYLAFLARSPLAQDGSKLEEALARGLSTMLGLSPLEERPPDETESESHLLIREVVSEFKSWLLHERGGECITAWGEIHLDGKNLLLRPFAFEEDEQHEPYTAAKYESPGRSQTADP